MRAFPNNEKYTTETHGMELRDYFAAKALMSMLSPVQDITPSTPIVAARLAYKFADAMMEACK
jgi:hypothetical protein